MRFIVSLLFLFSTTSLSTASPTLTLLCEGEEQSAIFGAWKKISSIITIEDGKFSSEDNLKRQYGSLLTSGKVTFTEEEILLEDGGINRINRTTGYFTYSKKLQAYSKNVNIRCAPQEKLF